MYRRTLIFSLFLLPIGPAPAEDAPAGPDRERFRGEVGRLLEQLDSGQFEVRRRAAAELEELASRPEWGRLLSAEFARVLVQPDVSFEVRWHLKRWCARLPEVPPEPPEHVAGDELDRLVEQLNDDSYAARLGAARRLEWLTGNAKLVCPVMVRLKRRLDDPALGGEDRHVLESTWHQVRGTWLLSDPGGWQLPAVSGEQIDRWIDDLARPAPVKNGSQPVQSTARRELEDLLARDEYLPRVKQALQSRLSRRLAPEAAARLKKVLELTRPAMVAEYWYARRHTTEQHLLVDVPSLGPEAVRPSHFDRIDDRVAHCVSGNTLSQGDYPVGVAFPSPKPPSGFFHLVNLPTPRRRMAYAHYVRTDEARRLTALSRRTLQRMLGEKRGLSPAELLMLAQLDADEVSRFAGKYFHAVRDRPLWSPQIAATSWRDPRQGQPSLFGMLCAQLAVDGTRAAMPGLLEAIDRGRFLPPGSTAPYRLHHVAALSIAIRDPWPSVDAWLAGSIARNEMLVEGRPGGPESGATAAAVLLERHRRQPGPFELQPAPDPVLARIGVDGYRFGSAEAPRRVQQWWEREKNSHGPSQTISRR